MDVMKNTKAAGGRTIKARKDNGCVKKGGFTVMNLLRDLERELE